MSKNTNPRQIHAKLVDKLFALWALVIPISSFVIIPSIKGTFPSTILAIGSLFVLPTSVKKNSRKILNILVFTFLFAFIIFTSVSQLSLAITPGSNLLSLPLINREDATLLLRSSLFTQTLYMIPCGILFLYTLAHYKASWDKYILIGIILIALYGFYEFLYFLIFHSNGDFISNRMTSGSDEIRSIFATVTIGSFSVGRLKSLTGEPSMYAFTVVPYWIYFSNSHHKFAQSLILFSILLTGSTTAIIGIFIYIIASLAHSGSRRRLFIILVVVFLLILLILIYIPDIYDVFIASKLVLDSGSSGERYNTFMQCWSYFINSPWYIKLFGIGFGYIRSADFLTTLLVNNGVIGLLMTIIFFTFPAWALNNDRRNFNLKVSLIAVLVMMLVSVPEFSLQSMWLLLGMAYREVWLSWKTPPMIPKIRHD